jgi:hypothetical protein
VVVLLAAAADILLFHYLFETLLDRSGLILAWRSRLIASAAHWGLASVVSALLLPFIYMQFFKRRIHLPLNFCSILLGAWILLVSMVSIMALDHTRVTCLVTVAPLLMFLRSQESGLEGTQAIHRPKLFAVLLLSRLVIPHIDEQGLHLFHWHF